MENQQEKFEEESLLEAQIRSMRLLAPRALDYHFQNYSSAQAGIRFDWKEGEKVDVKDHARRIETVRFELIAYLNWLGRIYHFVKNIEKKKGVKLEMDEGFLLFRKKWAAHRSVDDPQGEDYDLHLQITLNLDTSQRFNEMGEYEPEIKYEGSFYTFNLIKKHPEYISWLEELFAKL